MVWDYERSRRKGEDREGEFEERLRVDFGIEGQSAFEVLTSDKVVEALKEHD